MTARKNLIFGLKQVYKKKSKKEIEEIADRYLELVDLAILKTNIRPSCQGYAAESCHCQSFCNESRNSFDG